jgi:hypothetical protein
MMTAPVVYGFALEPRRKFAWSSSSVNLLIVSCFSLFLEWLTTLPS